MLPERQYILEHLLEPDYHPAKIKELSRVFDVTAPEYQQFRRLIHDLEAEGTIVRVQGRRFAHPRRMQHVWGRLTIMPRGFGIVQRVGDKADIMIGSHDLAGASDGDWVEVELLGTSTSGGVVVLRGRVVTIRDLPTHFTVGHYLARGSHGAVRLKDGRHSVVPLRGTGDTVVNDGDIVLVEVEDVDADHRPCGRIVRVLGSPKDARLDATIVAARHGIPLEHSSQAVAEATALTTQQVATQLAGRRDLRELICVTIDPSTAKDFDDALSLEMLESGEQRLGVHIADVSHYVTRGSAIDCDARDRGTSVYLCDQVLHMLPPQLAAQCCSLQPHEDRLAISVFLDIDGAGRVIATDATLSVIRSAARLTYEQVQAVIDGQPGCGAAAAHTTLLEEMTSLSQRLQARRIERGALDFDVPEPRVELDETGMPTELSRQMRLSSHRLVEQFMLAANEAVAAQMVDAELPALFRIHELPDPKKLERVVQVVSSFGQRLPPVGKIGSHDLQQILMHFESRREAPLIGQLILRAMMRARYATTVGIHFGLACDTYLHFTSPIRRYPDLHVHRWLKAAITGTVDQQPVDDVDWLAQWTTHTERRAVDAERELLRLKQLRFMHPRVGEEFEGSVRGIVGSGFFVELDDLSVEGFCPLRLLDDYYEFDENRLRLLCAQTGVTLRLGTRTRVQVVRVDLEAMQMDLLLLHAATEARVEKRQRKDHGGRGKRLRPGRRRGGHRRSSR